MDLNYNQDRLILNTVLIMFGVTTLATILRPMLIDQALIFTLLGAANSLILAILWFYLRSTVIVHWHRILVTSIGFATIIPLIVISGGVNSQFASLLPSLPVFVCLIIGVRTSWFVTFAICSFAVLFVYFIDYFPDVTNSPESLAKTYSRAFWLCLACIISSVFSSIFYKINAKLSKKLYTQAFEDGLTKVPNRRSILDFLKDAMDDAKGSSSSLSLVMLDVDNFKLLNDTHGHIAGDKCLQEMARILQKNVRSDTDRLGRYGGEEFLIVLPNTQSETAFKIAEHLRQEVAAASIELSDKVILKLTCTFGIATYLASETSSNMSVTSLIQEADKALYRGKNSGRNCVVAA